MDVEITPNYSYIFNFEQDFIHQNTRYLSRPFILVASPKFERNRFSFSSYFPIKKTIHKDKTMNCLINHEKKLFSWIFVDHGW